MSDSSTMTIRLSSDTKELLGRLAADTRRSRSFLAAEAVAAYVEREQSIVDGIKRGMADLKAGRTVSHETAIMELSTTIEANGTPSRG